MRARLDKVLRAARDAIERHGGGWTGLRRVIERSFRVARVLGVRGLVRRIKGAASRSAPPPPPASQVQFPEAAALDAVMLKVGVMAHVFYPDLIEEFASYLQTIPKPFVLLVSVVDPQAKQLAEERFSRIPLVQELQVRVVPNRGRDIAPLLVTFRQEVLALDLVCHVHTKKSLYTGSEQGDWRRYLLDSLLGTADRTAWILGLFQAMPGLGLLYPETFRSVPMIAHTWLGNLKDARELGHAMGIDIDPHAYLDFPAGSMFWARVEAIRPLFELGLTVSSFPEEHGQKDGTLQHALERMLGQVVAHQGMLRGVLPSHGDRAPRTEGARNWHAHFDVPIGDQIVARSGDADVVSFDVFDTLVTRPFLTPDGARAYLEHRVGQRFGLTDFAALRQRAEARARARSNTDVDLHAIYESFAELPEAAGKDVSAIRQMELEQERTQLRPRVELCRSALRAASEGKSVVAVSDMYLDEATLRNVLPLDASKAVSRFHVSCDSGWRKDSGEAWRRLPEKLGTQRESWLHVGDNEHSDAQVPGDLGFIAPAHVLRPSSLLEVVPSLRSLKPSSARSVRWPDQLWLGLIANRFSSLADVNPQAFRDTILLEDQETVGYVAFGPLIMDYLSWLARSALEAGATKILFLSREGYLLQQAFSLLQPHLPASPPLEGAYFLASRRAVGTATLREIEDVDHLLGGVFTGTLQQLVRARMGDAIADVVRSMLGEQAVQAAVFLPEMRGAVIEMLRPTAGPLLELARKERDAYLSYWSRHAGDGRVVLSDVGYAGTIQTHLARLTGRPLFGAYFALNARAEQTRLHAGEAAARFHDARNTPGKDCAVLRHDLLIESILTAPTPQFSHFELEGEDLRPQYTRDDGQQARFAGIEGIQRGIKAFVNDVCAVVGDDVIHMAFDPELVQRPLSCLGSGLWQPGGRLGELLVDDDYSGRGTVRIQPVTPA